LDAVEILIFYEATGRRLYSSTFHISSVSYFVDDDRNNSPHVEGGHMNKEDLDERHHKEYVGYIQHM
jgi:hypothetical protein